MSALSIFNARTPREVLMDDRLRSALRIAIVASVYFVLAKAGLSLAVVHASATAVWPPAGIAIAAMLIYGPRVWPGIAIGAFLANVTTAGNLATSAGIATGNTLEAVLGAWLVNQYAGGRYALDTIPGIYKFVGLGALISTLVAATIGVGSLVLGGFADFDQFRAIWVTWWLGDAVGVIIAGALILHWYNHPRPRWPRHLPEAVFAVFCFVVTGFLFFGDVGGTDAPIAWIWIPVTVYISYRFGQRAAATAMFALAILAVVGTVLGYGPFALPSRNESLLLLQAYLGVITISSLTLSAAVQAQTSAMLEVERSRDELEDRVRDRTEAHGRLYQSLKAEIAERLRLQTELVEAGETERLRLGRDLHDDLGQLLTGILFLAGAMEKRMGPENPQGVEAAAEIRNLVREAISKTRLLSLGLTPVSLGTGGLRAAVQELANMTQRVFDVECRVEYPLDLFVERPVASTNLYRIVQEAISNAVRHGGCRRIDVTFGLDVGRLMLTVRDDGEGLSNPPTDRKGLGLEIMKYRVEMLGGTLEILSDSTGTTVLCAVPGAARREPTTSTDPPLQ